MNTAENIRSPDKTAERLERTERYVREQDTVKNIAAARLAHRLLDGILAEVKPGVSESEIKAYAIEHFKRHGIERTWHPPYVRFGANTLLTFMDTAKDDLVLQENDIAFIDIGIVYENIEGDAGRTLVFGDHPTYAALKAASENIFHQARAFWKERNPTGIALYEYIHALAERAGFQFCLDPAGHLIGEFPHRGWKRGINHFPKTVDAGTWILEIQVRHPTQPCAAFYENLLY